MNSNDRKTNNGWENEYKRIGPYSASTISPSL